MDNKLRMQSINKVNKNIKKISELFPNCVTEGKDKDGKSIKVVDFDTLKQELSDYVVEGRDERYLFTWPDKKKAIQVSNARIDKTLRPKVNESIDYNLTKNIYIEGDNLDALKLLQETYLGRVKMIYIDPPYNTGSDFVYNDNFKISPDEYNKTSGQYSEDNYLLVQNKETNGRFHTDWLNMIYPRLRLARELLSDDGVIFISIDESEFDNLKKISSEIFGESNYAGEIVWKNSSKNDQSYISVQHEYILCYVKNKNFNSGEWFEPKEGVDEINNAFMKFKSKCKSDWKAIHAEALNWYRQFPKSDPIYSSKHYSWMDEKGVYFAADISGPNFGQYRYDVIHPITGKVCKEPGSGWRYPEKTMIERIKKGLVHFGDDETTIPKNKVYLNETVNQSFGSVKFKDGRVASNQLKELMGGNYFTNPKDVSVLKTLMRAINLQNEDIVLDFFAGSSSTGQAVMEYNEEYGSNCRFIMVQLEENLEIMLSKATGSSKQVLNNAIELCDNLARPRVLTEIGKERLKRAGENIKTCDDGARIDVGFRVFYVDTTNMEKVYYKPEDYEQTLFEDVLDNIKSDRTPEDLLFQAMLELGVLLSSKIEGEAIEGKNIFNIADGYLIACFDKEVSEKTIEAVAKKKPYYFVMRDFSLANDNVATNFNQIFEMYSPETIRKVL